MNFDKRISKLENSTPDKFFDLSNLEGKELMDRIRSLASYGKIDVPNFLKSKFKGYEITK